MGARRNAALEKSFSAFLDFYVVKLILTNEQSSSQNGDLFHTDSHETVHIAVSAPLLASCCRPPQPASLTSRWLLLSGSSYILECPDVDCSFNFICVLLKKKHLQRGNTHLTKMGHTFA